MCFFQNGQKPALSIGICVPDSCTSKDMLTLVQTGKSILLYVVQKPSYVNTERVAFNTHMPSVIR